MADKDNRSGKKNALPHRKTSIGRSVNSRAVNKHKKNSFKRYRGQGK